jgi:hypothetical protein
MKFSDTLLFMRLKLLSILSWENKKHDDDSVQDVCCDKLDMLYICELQTMSVELVHDERFYVYMKKQEKFLEAKTKKSSTRNVNMENQKTNEITME